MGIDGTCETEVRALDEALENGRLDEARRLLEALRAHRPDDARIEERSRRASLLGFPCPLPREPYVARPVPAPDPSSIDLVYFTVDPVASDHSRLSPYFEVLGMALDGAMLRAPRARRVLLTDEVSYVPAGFPVHEVIRKRIDLGCLMYERIRVWIDFLEQRARHRPSVLLDPDVVVNREPSAVFREAFDLGLTWRSGFPEGRFNGGVVFAAPGDRAARFMERVLTCYDALVADPRFGGGQLRAWWGDQFALAAVVGHREFAGRGSEGLVVAGSRVRFFQCEQYNWTPEPQVQYEIEQARLKFFVHFKGDRKLLQKSYVDLMRSGKV